MSTLELSQIKRDVDEFISHNKDKYEIINTFQDYLNQLKSESYQETISFVEKHKNIFFKNHESILFFMYSILDSCINNFKNFEQVLDICIQFSKEIKSDNDDSIEIELIGICMIFTNSISYLFSKGFFSLKTIITKSFQNHFIFVNFLPEIEKYDKKLAEKRKKIVLSLINLENDEKMLSFYETVISDYRQHILNRNLNYHPSSLHKSIRNDDIETFQSLLSKNNYDMNKSIPFSYYERTKTINMDLPPIKVAALYGSVKIFKFLLMNNATLIDNLLCYAYFGANIEIIHLIETKCPHFDVYIQPIITHNHELFEYYIENFDDKIIEENDDVKNQLKKFVSDENVDENNLCEILNSECLAGAVSSFNYPIITSCIHKIAFVITNNELIQKNINLGVEFILNAEFDFDLFSFFYSLMKSKFDVFQCPNFCTFVMFSQEINSSEVYKFLLMEFKNVIDLRIALINGIKVNYIYANLILDFLIDEKNSNKKQDSLYERYKNIISFKDMICAIEYYNEEIVVKLIQLFDFLDSNDHILKFALLLTKTISDEMIISLYQKLHNCLPQNKIESFLRSFNIIGYTSILNIL